MLSCMILRANETYSSRALLVEHSVDSYGKAIIQEHKSTYEDEYHVMSILMAHLCETGVRRKLTREVGLRLPSFSNTCKNDLK